MPRLKLDMPDDFVFTAELPVRITDINYGGHLGNDAVLALVHETRVRWLMEHQWTEFNVEGVGIIMTDAAVVYKSEAFYGESLRIQLSVRDLTTLGCDLYYRLRERESGRDVAHVKTGIAFFDYSVRKLAPVPEPFRKLFG